MSKRFRNDASIIVIIVVICSNSQSVPHITISCMKIISILRAGGDCDCVSQGANDDGVFVRGEPSALVAGVWGCNNLDENVECPRRILCGYFPQCFQSARDCAPSDCSAFTK